MVTKILKKNKRALGESGLTLIEVLVAIGIFSFVTAGVVDLLLKSWYARDVVFEQLDTQNEGRKVIQDFVNELRTANFSSIGSYPIETAQSSTIVFYSDIDHDTLRGRVRYFLPTASTTLKKGVIKPFGAPLAYDPLSEVVVDIVHDVTTTGNPIFTYYDQSYSSASGTAMGFPIDIPMVRMVGISLSLEEDPHFSPAPFNIESKVEIRNLKSN